MISSNVKTKVEESRQDQTISDQGLVVRTVRARYWAHLLLGGQLDSYSAHMLDRWIRHLEKDGCAHVTVDLEDLDFIDSNGLKVLSEAARRAGEGGWRLRVVNPQGPVRTVFDITQMDSLISYFGNRSSSAS